MESGANTWLCMKLTITFQSKLIEEVALLTVTVVVTLSTHTLPIFPTEGIIFTYIICFKSTSVCRCA